MQRRKRCAGLRHKVRAGSIVIAEDDYYRCSSTIPDFDPATHNFDAPSAKEHALLRDHLALARSGEAFAHPALHTSARPVVASNLRPWTDDYNNLLQVLR